MSKKGFNFLTKNIQGKQFSSKAPKTVCNRKLKKLKKKQHNIVRLVQKKLILIQKLNRFNIKFVNITDLVINDILNATVAEIENKIIIFDFVKKTHLDIEILTVTKNLFNTEDLTTTLRCMMANEKMVENQTS